MSAGFEYAVIFDLDGTLVDSAADIAASVDFAMSRLGLEPPSLGRIKTFIGEGAARLIHRALTNDFDGVADASLHTSASREFFNHYEENVCRNSTAYPGVEETLAALRTRGYGMACATNKPTRFATPLLEALNLDHYFSICLGGDSLSTKKPDPAQLLCVAEHFKLPRAHCTMIGDSATDIRAANNAAMPVIAVDYGYGDRAEMARLKPRAMVSSITEIPALLPSAPVAA